MIQVSFLLSHLHKNFSIRFNKFLSFILEKGGSYLRILGLNIPITFKKKRFRLPLQKSFLKNLYLFIRQWKLKRIEAKISFPDPMVNGVAYGMLKVIETIKREPRVNVEINFLGINQLRGDFIISILRFFQYSRKLFFPLLKEMRRGFKKGGRF
jgi:hypothetical protein